MWGKTCCGCERVVEFVAAADGLGLLPGAGVGVEGVGEVLAAFVGDFVGPGGGAEEGDAEGVAGCVVAVLGVVEDGEALLGVAEVGPAHGGDFELGFLPGVVAGGGALDGAVGDLVGGFGAGGGEGEGGFEEDVGFVPVDVVVDDDGVGVGVEGDVLDEFGGLPGAGDADGLAERALSVTTVTESTLVMGVMWSRVPGSMFQASYCFGVSLKVWSWLPQALGARDSVLEGSVDEAGDAAGLAVDDEFEVGVLESDRPPDCSSMWRSVSRSCSSCDR